MQIAFGMNRRKNYYQKYMSLILHRSKYQYKSHSNPQKKVRVAFAIFLYIERISTATRWRFFIIVILKYLLNRYLNALATILIQRPAEY